MIHTRFLLVIIVLLSIAFVATGTGLLDLYNREAPTKFIREFKTESIDKLRQRLHDTIDEEFVRAVIKEMPPDLLSAIIRRHAIYFADSYLPSHLEFEDVVMFAFKYGADPSLLAYPIKRLAMHDRKDGLRKLRKQIGDRIEIDFDAIINTKLEVAALQSLVVESGTITSEMLAKEKVDLSNGEINAATLDRLLQLSARYGDFKLAKFLLENGANVDVKPSSLYNINYDETSSRTPLSWAVSGGFVDITQLLLAYGAEISYYPSELNEPSEKGLVEIVRLLLYFGADVNPHGYKPLKTAVENNQPAVARILLEHGADVHDFVDDVLFMPSIEGQVEVVKVLLEHGATVHPYYAERAKDEQHFEVAELLNKHGLIQSIRRGNLQNVQEFIELGAKIEPSMIHSAESKGLKDITNELKQHGLRQAVESGDFDAVRWFLKNGAAVDASIIQLATAKDQAEIIYVLKQHGLRHAVESGDLNGKNSGESNTVKHLLP